MPDLLLEVGCEELPSSACREIVEQAPELMGAALAAQGLEGTGVGVSVAPRRFAVRVSGLPAELAATSRTVRGPAAAAAFGPDGAPTKAGEGFARGQGVAVSDLVVREDGGREFVFAELRSEGRDVAEVVPDLAARLVDGLRFSKTMRWGDGTGLRFSRPVRWVVAKLDEQTVPFELHGLTAGDVSQGHRFLGGPADDRRPRRLRRGAARPSGSSRPRGPTRGHRRRPRPGRGRGRRGVERPGRQDGGGRLPGRVAERHHRALRRPPPAAARRGCS